MNISQFHNNKDVAVSKGMVHHLSNCCTVWSRLTVLIRHHVCHRCNGIICLATRACRQVVLHSILCCRLDNSCCGGWCRQMLMFVRNDYLSGSSILKVSHQSWLPKRLFMSTPHHIKHCTWLFNYVVADNIFCRKIKFLTKTKYANNSFCRIFVPNMCKWNQRDWASLFSLTSSIVL